MMIALTLVSFLAIACNSNNDQNAGGGTGMQEEQQRPDSAQPNQNTGTNQ